MSLGRLCATQPFFSVGGALRDDTKNGCVADYQKLLALMTNTFGLPFLPYRAVLFFFFLPFFFHGENAAITE